MRSRPGSRRRNVIRAEASRTAASVTACRLVAAVAEPFVGQADAGWCQGGEIILGLADGVAQGGNAQAVVVATDEDLDAFLEAERLAELGGDDDAAGVGDPRADEFGHVGASLQYWMMISV